MYVAVAEGLIEIVLYKYFMFKMVPVLGYAPITIS